MYMSNVNIKFRSFTRRKKRKQGEWGGGHIHVTQTLRQKS